MKSREAMEMDRDLASGTGGLGSCPIFVPPLFCDLVTPSHSNHARPPESRLTDR